MPFLVPFIPAIIGGAAAIGGAVLSSNAANKASKNAINAENAATQSQIQAQTDARNANTALQQPFINAGYGALGQLQSIYGYGGQSAPARSSVNPYATGANATQGAANGNPAPVGLMTAGNGNAGYQALPGVSGAKTSGGMVVDPASAGPAATAPNPYVGGITQTTPGQPATQAGAPDWQGYIQQHPDVAAWIQQGHGDPNLGPNQTPEQAAQYQYENSFRIGNPEPAPPTFAGSPGTPDTTSLSPADQALSEANGQRPTFQTPDYGTAPSASSYFANFQQDPGYQFALNQGMRAQQASFGARGLLKSDAAIKGAGDYAQGMANQQYGNWWNRQNTLLNEDRNQFNTDRSANYNIFSNDRNFSNNNFEDTRSYNTNRYDNTANNLFRVVSLGTGAAAAVGGANTNYANYASNIYGQQGQNQANNALANGATNSQLIGSIAGTAGNFLNLNSLGGSGGNASYLNNNFSNFAATPSASSLMSSLAGSW